jgi:YVTN family beta-propeller protein
LNDQSKNIQLQQQQQQPTASTISPNTSPNATPDTIPDVTPNVTPDVTPSSTLTVIKHVVCDFTAVSCPTADQFTITATTGNGSSHTFSGSEGDTPLTINRPFPVTYNVTEVSPTQGFVVATIPVGNTPRGIAFNSINGNLYVTNAADDTVTVINGTTNTVVGSPIPVGDDPFAIAFNPDNGDLYVVNAADDTVTVINGTTNTVVGTPIPVGDAPFAIAFNPDNGDLYVTNFGDDTVSVIAPLTTTFSEGCNGTIGSAGQTATCTITNAYGRPA